MYSLFEIQEEISILQFKLRRADTTRQKILLSNKINIKKELFEIMKNKRHFIVV